jgi:N-acetylmuramoyl-L-alanine amidase
MPINGSLVRRRAGLASDRSATRSPVPLRGIGNAERRCSAFRLGIPMLLLVVAVCLMAGCSLPTTSPTHVFTASQTVTVPIALNTPSQAPSPHPTTLPSATPEPTSTSIPPTATPSPTPSPMPPLIAIDAGHGGRDLGAVVVDSRGRLDLTESAVNLAIAMELWDQLLERGYRVFMVREGDYELNSDLLDVNGDGVVNYIDELQARVDAINEVGADLLLSIHQNAFYRPDGSPRPDVGGTVTFYCADRPFSADNLRFAQLVQAELVATFQELGHDAHDRGVRQDSELRTASNPEAHLILLGPKTERIARPSQMPGALSETLFLTHRVELTLVKEEAVLRRLALAYADAIDAYYASSDAATEPSSE